MSGSDRRPGSTTCGRPASSTPIDEGQKRIKLEDGGKKSSNVSSIILFGTLEQDQSLQDSLCLQIVPNQVFFCFKDDDIVDKSDGDLVVDVGNEDESGSRQSFGVNGEHREGSGSGDRRGERPPSNMSSSSRSTPSLKPGKEGNSGSSDKPGTPGSKPSTPNGQSNGSGKPSTPGASAAALAAGYPPGYPRPGEMPPFGYPLQPNGVPPPGMMGPFPPRPPLVIPLYFIKVIDFPSYKTILF